MKKTTISLLISSLFCTQAQAVSSMDLLRQSLPLAGTPMASQASAHSASSTDLAAGATPLPKKTSMDLLRESLPLAGYLPPSANSHLPKPGQKDAVLNHEKAVKLPGFLDDSASRALLNAYLPLSKTTPQTLESRRHTYPVWATKHYPIHQKLYHETSTRGQLFEMRIGASSKKAPYADSRKNQALQKSWGLLGETLPLAKGSPAPVAMEQDVITTSIMKPSWVQHDHHTSFFSPQYNNSFFGGQKYSELVDETFPSTEYPRANLIAKDAPTLAALGTLMFLPYWSVSLYESGAALAAAGTGAVAAQHYHRRRLSEVAGGAAGGGAAVGRAASSITTSPGTSEKQGTTSSSEEIHFSPEFHRPPGGGGSGDRAKKSVNKEDLPSRVLSFSEPRKPEVVDREPSDVSIFDGCVPNFRKIKPRN